MQERLTPVENSLSVDTLVNTINLELEHDMRWTEAVSFAEKHRQEIISHPLFQKCATRILPVLRRQSRLYGLHPADVFIRRKEDVAAELHKVHGIHFHEDSFRQSLKLVQLLAIIHYPLAKIITKSIIRDIASYETTDFSEAEMSAREMVDRVVWQTIDYPFGQPDQIGDIASITYATIRANLKHLDKNIHRRYRKVFNMDISDHARWLGDSQNPNPTQSKSIHLHQRTVRSSEVIFENSQNGLYDAVRKIRRIAQKMSWLEFSEFASALPLRQRFALLAYFGYFGNQLLKEVAEKYGMDGNLVRYYLIKAAESMENMVWEQSDLSYLIKKGSTLTDLARYIRNYQDQLPFASSAREDGSREYLMDITHRGFFIPGSMFTPTELKVFNMLLEVRKMQYVYSLKDIAQSQGLAPKYIEKLVLHIARRVQDFLSKHQFPRSYMWDHDLYQLVNSAGNPIDDGSYQAQIIRWFYQLAIDNPFLMSVLTPSQQRLVLEMVKQDPNGYYPSIDSLLTNPALGIAKQRTVFQSVHRRIYDRTLIDFLLDLRTKLSHLINQPETTEEKIKFYQHVLEMLEKGEPFYSETGKFILLKLAQIAGKSPRTIKSWLEQQINPF
jgi:DNA-binding CsgD family transcriptional regulator